MPRRFNTAGPCEDDIHYMLPPLRRIERVRRLIDNRAYFIIHAPRQVGKTTAFIALAQALAQEGRYVAVRLSMSLGSPVHDIGDAELAILDRWQRVTRFELPAELQPPPWPNAAAASRISAALQAWAESSPRPLVVFLDEIDSLENQVLLSVLRQLHDGYPYRPKGFPWSVALIGMRNIRDYKVSDTQKDRIGSASPFNISEESLTLRNFTQEEVAELYAQHTLETGQAFEPAVIERVYTLTEGQPWLVNALARMMVEELVTDWTKPITLDLVEPAKERVIRRRDTHFDSLAERLREDRVRKVMEPILLGDTLPGMPTDDRQYVVDIGLVRTAKTGGLEIANPIYAEVTPQLLAQQIDDSMGVIHPSWLLPDGSLDPDQLLQAFMEFWRQHGQALMGAAPYHEFAPHLVMMAFLHRVENGGGRLHREFAIGSGRLDLLLEFGSLRLPMELKVWRPDNSDPLQQGLRQIDDYLDGLGLATGWLVIFDRRPGAKRVEHRTKASKRKTPSGRRVTLIRA